jgi:hypothetical protein
MTKRVFPYVSRCKQIDVGETAWPTGRGVGFKRNVLPRSMLLYCSLLLASCDSPFRTHDGQIYEDSC